MFPSASSISENMEHFITDTIAAIATPPGNAGIGIIRISGDQAIPVAEKILRTASGKKPELSEKESHTIHYCFVYDDEKCIDEVLVSIFHAPRSYTAENTVEINCHGGMFVLKQVLKLVLKSGARLADPGEFSKRAFLNGRIDLTKAESVMDLISSENEFSLQNSIRHLKGSLYEKVCNIRESLLHECAYIEAALDDPEHYDLTGYTEELKRKLTDIYRELDQIIKDSGQAYVLTSGVRTVIVGKPNAGKSSVLNSLSGYEKAIVTGEAGTTRDAVEETISLNGLILKLIDTAGIRESENEAEQIGITRSKAYIDQADLILYIIDSSEALNENDREIISLIQDKKTLILYNKTDLDPVISESEIQKMIHAPIIPVSALTGSGISDVREKILEMFDSLQLTEHESLLITNERQMSCFQKARDSVQNVLNGIEKKDTEDVLTIGIMDAYTYLGSVIGESLEDDLADRIFSEFCMGK